MRLAARRRRRTLAPAGWLALSLVLVACLGLFAADRAATLLCAAMGERCVTASPSLPSWPIA